MVQVKNRYVIVVLLVLLASAIRFYNPVFRSIWGDESFSVYSAMEFPKHDLITSSMALAGASHMPVYFILLSKWIQMVGPGEYFLRLFSIIFGILGVIAFYFFALEFFEEGAALLSTFLLAISPMAVMYSQEIRMYSIMFLLSVLSTQFLWRLLSKKADILNCLSYFVFTALLLFTHIYAILFVAAQGLVTLYFLWRERNIRLSILTLILQAFALAAAAPIYLYIFRNALSSLASGPQDIPFAAFPAYIKPFFFFFALSLGEAVAPWNFLIVVPIGILFAYLFLSVLKRISDNRIVFLLILILFPTLAGAFSLPLCRNISSHAFLRSCYLSDIRCHFRKRPTSGLPF